MEFSKQPRNDSFRYISLAALVHVIKYLTNNNPPFLHIEHFIE